MRYALQNPGASPAVVTRLGTIATLDAADVATLDAAIAKARFVPRRAELLAEGQSIGEPRIIVDGWAARVRLLSDGRRQYLSFLLPGDLIGLCSQAEPLAVSTVTALTDVVVCAAPPPLESLGLRQAYAMSRAYDEAYLLAQIARLGRMTAQERVADLMLELHERLTLCGLTGRENFRLPLTQETLADMIGLTSVHVNRTLQLARGYRELSWRQGVVTVHDPAALALKIGRVPVRVTGSAAAASENRPLY